MRVNLNNKPIMFRTETLIYMYTVQYINIRFSCIREQIARHKICKG